MWHVCEPGASPAGRGVLGGPCRPSPAFATQLLIQWHVRCSSRERGVPSWDQGWGGTRRAPNGPSSLWCDSKMRGRAWGRPGRCCPRSRPGLGLCVFPWPRTPEQRPPRGLLPRPLGRSEWTRVAHLFRPVDTEVGSPRVVSVRRTSQKRQFRRGRHQGVDAKQAGNAGRGLTQGRGGGGAGSGWGPPLSAECCS